MVLTIDEVNDILDEMAEGFPEVLFEELNGGVNLLEEAMPDPEFPEGEMYIMGEYCTDMLGQYINLYYGSFAALAEREEWDEAVWQETAIGSEGAVAVHIRHLREKIEINPSEPRYLKVVWGQGYKMEGGK